MIFDRHPYKKLMASWAMLGLLLCPSPSFADDSAERLAADSPVLDAAPPTRAIPVGAILPLTGELASKGVIRQAAIELAVDGVNEYLQQTGHGFQLDLTVADSASNPEKTLDVAEQMRRSGTDIFIVGASSEVAALEDWSNRYGTVVFSYSSTAPSLAVAGDGIFRLVPNDYHQADALAVLLEHEGIHHVAMVYRDDLYGQDLSRLLKEALSQRGIETAEPIVYQPNTTDFQPLIDTLAERLQESQADLQQTGIVLLAFDEAAEILAHADQLPTVRWFGGDTIALSPAILNNERSASQAVAVSLQGVTFGIDETTLYRKVKVQLEASFGPNIIPDAIFAYDIPWLLATVMQELDDPGDPAALRANIVAHSKFYAGATGWVILNEQGDRQYSLYDVWQVRENASGFDWERVGAYRRDPGLPGYFIDKEALERAAKELEQMQPIYSEPVVSRAEFIYLLTQLLDPSAEVSGSGAPFTDVSQHELDEGVYRALAYAASKQMIVGYEDGRFRPQQPITLSEIAVVLQRALDLTSRDCAGASINNEEEIPGWAASAAASTVGCGIIPLTDDGRFDPQATVMSTEATQLLFRAFDVHD